MYPCPFAASLCHVCAWHVLCHNRICLCAKLCGSVWQGSSLLPWLLLGQRSSLMSKSIKETFAANGPGPIHDHIASSSRSAQSASPFPPIARNPRCSKRKPEIASGHELAAPGTSHKSRGVTSANDKLAMPVTRAAPTPRDKLLPASLRGALLRTPGTSSLPSFTAASSLNSPLVSRAGCTRN